MVELGFLSLVEPHLDDVEAPRQLSRAQRFEPGVGTPLDQVLLDPVHRRQGTDLWVAASGLDFHKHEQPTVTCDDIDLPAAWRLEIAGKDAAAAGLQVPHSTTLTKAADPLTVARLTFSRDQTAGRVERPAETSDDDGGKGRVSEALQDALSCHIPDGGQSRIGEILGQFPP